MKRSLAQDDTDFSASCFDVVPRIMPPLDPDFRPLSLGIRQFRAHLATEQRRATLVMALERDGGAISRLDLELFPANSGHDADNFRYASWMLHFLLWSRGGWRLRLAGPPWVCEALQQAYRPGGTHDFDVALMSQAYGCPFVVEPMGLDEIPEAVGRSLTLGGHLDGCRIGFDLGASDYKVAALMDGEVTFSAEFPWDPGRHADPTYHIEHIQHALRKASEALPRVDAIGGSSAGILVDSQVRVSSLFRAVPAPLFDAQVRSMFLRMRDAWGVPFEVINDGEVTALAGAMSLGQNGILGIAMGSSEAAGFLDRNGHITGWLNELAFAPVDANPCAGSDDWSRHPGIGAAYFSQRAVDRLARRVAHLPEEMPLPERLLLIQERLRHGDGDARRVFESIGIYLGYTIPWYVEHYDLAHVMILGRVTSGVGGEILLAEASRVLASEFPDIAGKVDILLPDEGARRVGQAVAAASLPRTREEVVQ